VFSKSPWKKNLHRENPKVTQSSTEKFNANNYLMTRLELIKKLGRYLLLMLMTLIVLMLGNRVVADSDCSSCPGRGICNGKTDCNNYYKGK
jgi:hypothetical protein